MALLRRPRFQRSATALPFQLTERDVQIVRRVFEHRFLNSTQISRLVPGSRQQTLRRLQSLFHHGYLDRPRCQIDHFHQLGTRPIVYGLGRNAARIVHAAQEPSRWTFKNSATKRTFLDHALQVADVLIAFELACRSRSEVEFVPSRDLALGNSCGDATQIRWNVSFGGETIAIVPDAVFALDIKNANGKRERIHYFVEADRGTMPVIRRKLSQTSLLRKLLSYEATWSQGVHRAILGIDRFRVLTVTTSQERIQHLRDACSRLQRGHGLFLFTDAATLDSVDELLSLSWITGKHAPTTSTIFT